MLKKTLVIIFYRISALISHYAFRKFSKTDRMLKFEDISWKQSKWQVKLHS